MTGGWGTPTWMKVNTPELGETFVWGQTKETAQRLLAAARETGHEVHEVRAVTGGFIVPNDVWDYAEAMAEQNEI